MKMTEYMIAARRRPIGVILLSLLALLGGLVLAGVATFAAYHLSTSDQAEVIAERLAAIGLPLPLLAVGLLFLMVIGLGSGVGMWFGTQWGWYLATFGYAYAIVRNLNAIWITQRIFASMPAAEFAAMPHSPAYYYFKFAVRSVIAALILLYLFKGSVRAFFQLDGVSSWRVLAAELVGCGFIVAGVTFAAAMLQ
jgi:hypothetical protein